MITSKRVSATSYSLDVSVKDLLAIMDKDDKRSVTANLWEKLSRIDGVTDVDYGGHFGPHIYLTIEIEHDNKNVWGSIYKTIKSYL